LTMNYLCDKYNRAKKLLAGTLTGVEDEKAIL